MTISKINIKQNFSSNSACLKIINTIIKYNCKMIKGKRKN